MFYSKQNSALYWKVYRVYHVSDRKDYVKLKLEAFYKTSGEPCQWIKRKNYKIIKSVYDHWERYYPYKEK